MNPGTETVRDILGENIYSINTVKNQIRLTTSNYYHKELHLIYSYSSTDSWKPPIQVSGWLIFCCGNSILHQKKNENDKNTNFMMKNKKTKQKKKPKNRIKALSKHFL